MQLKKLHNVKLDWPAIQEERFSPARGIMNAVVIMAILVGLTVTIATL